MLNYRWMKIHQKEVVLLLLGTLLILSLQLWSHRQEGAGYLEERHQVVAIQRENLDEAQSVPLILEIEIDGEMEAYDVMVSFMGNVSEENDEDALTDQSEDLLSVAIDEIVSELERNEDALIPLPQKLGNGLNIRWKKPSKIQDFLILLLFPLGILFLYRHESEEEKKRNIEKQICIRRALPAFNDQILLLLHSGLIFYDAFFRIAENYRVRENLDSFERIVVDIADEVKGSGKSILSIMEESKIVVGCREYSRMVNILTDHQMKGVDLQEKLESESRLLWEGRKTQSLQKGKEMETKLTFPLAILLLVVVMIAGVPAMMNM